MAQQSLVGQCLFIIDALRSHSDTPQAAGLLWMRDRPDAETSTWQQTPLTTDRHSCPLGDSNTVSVNNKTFYLQLRNTREKWLAIWSARYFLPYWSAKLHTPGVHESVHRDTTIKTTKKMRHTDQFIILSRLYMFRAMFSPIIRSTWLYLQYLVVFIQVAAGWCQQQLGWTLPDTVNTV